MIELNVISANEARAYIEDDWREKLNEIYDGVRAAIVKKDNSYCHKDSCEQTFFCYFYKA